MTEDADTVTEDGVAPSAQAVEVEQDGIYTLPDGTVRFRIDGAPYTLRTPKIGQFRYLHQEWVRGTGLPATEQFDHQIRWVRALFNGDPNAEPPMPGLSDHRLGDDESDWPSWVGVPTWQLRVMSHFRDVPLAPGTTATR